MERFRSILFFADGARGEKSALDRTMDMVRQTGARLTVMDVVARVDTGDETLDPRIERLQQARIAERQEVLENLVANIDDIDLSIRVVPGDKDFIEIIRTVANEKFDLLIKAANRQYAISAALFGNTDLRLMRQCPCPVWMMKPGRRRTISRILAAVDLSREARASLELAERIVDVSASIAHIEGAHLDVVTALEQPIDKNLAVHSGNTTIKELNRAHHEQVHRRFDALLRPYQELSPGEILKNGSPERIITKLVEETGVDLLVMGTLSRSGIPGLLIGNTAERVLNDVDCSVLTLKPKGFKASL